MKLTHTTTLAAAAMLVASASVHAADEVVVTGTPKTTAISAYQRAMSACIDGFLAEILPGNKERVRAVIGPSTRNAFVFLNRPVPMDVKLTVRSAPGNTFLAAATCSVDRKARVLSLTVPFRDSAQLAQLSLKDLELAAVAR
jgi:hypothetical protein